MERGHARTMVNVLVAAMLLTSAWMIHIRSAQATQLVDVYSVLPPKAGSLYQYGMHFDETGYSTFMGRDWSMSGLAYHRVKLLDSAATDTWWKYTHHGNCGVKAQAGYKDGGGTFHEYSGEVFHYLHMTYLVANNSVTTQMTSVGTTYQQEVGTLSTCNTNQIHSHQSGDIGPSTPLWRYIQSASADTCWSDSVSTVQCPNTYKKDNSAYTPCPPGAWDGTYARPSGGYTRYVCQTWAGFTWNSTSRFMTAKWLI